MKLEVEQVTKRFGEQAALEEINLRIPDGHRVAFIGPSGGGKSTLLRLLAGLDLPDAGRIGIDELWLPRDEPGLQQYRRSVGVVFQAYNLFPHLSALENLMLPLTHVHGVAREAARERSLSILDRLGLKEHAEKRPAELSGGMNQRVAIARALAVRPKLLLLDEPTSALDPEMTAEVLSVIHELGREGRDFILVTHEMGFARQVADHVVFLANGRVVESGPVEEVFDRPAEEVTRRFLEKILRY